MHVQYGAGCSRDGTYESIAYVGRFIPPMTNQNVTVILIHGISLCQISMLLFCLYEPPSSVWGGCHLEIPSRRMVVVEISRHEAWYYKSHPELHLNIIIYHLNLSHYLLEI